jgi:cystathionine beta-lyase/cystathionine gamma-synthase
MTHGKVDDALKPELGITENLIRLSVGVENADDLIQDLSKSLDLLI